MTIKKGEKKMSIYENLCEMLKDVSIEKEKRNMVKFLVAELQRVSTEKDKSVNDDIAIKVLKKIIKNAKESMDLFDERYEEDKKATQELIDFIYDFCLKNLQKKKLLIL